MKGLLLIAGFVMLSVETNAQRVFYTSGKGIAEYNADSSGWIYDTPQPSDLKIYVGPKSITINDEKKSTYTLVSEAPRNEKNRSKCRELGCPGYERKTV